MKDQFTTIDLSPTVRLIAEYLDKDRWPTKWTVQELRGGTWATSAIFNKGQTGGMFEFVKRYYCF